MEKQKALIVISQEERVKIRKEFFSLNNLEDVASFLHISNRQLIYYSFIAPENKRYKQFDIRKKNGDNRPIHAPAKTLKRAQKILNYKLQALYEPINTAHGFIKKYENNEGQIVTTNIITCASLHIKKRLILNIDLKNFFPSITAQRVYGLFMNQYNLNKEVSRILTRICCYGSILPQGAPTSPIISNMICSRLDRKIRKYCSQNSISYTRYADDLSFSTHKKKLPESFEMKIKEIIESEGFEVNPNKSRLLVRENKLEVVGLTVNKKVNISRKYIRNIRAILHSWEIEGIQVAARKLGKILNRNTNNPQKMFLQVLKGRIDFIGNVRSKDNDEYSIYNKFKTKFNILLKRDDIEDNIFAGNLSGISITRKVIKPFDLKILMKELEPR